MYMVLCLFVWPFFWRSKTKSRNTKQKQILNVHSIASRNASQRNITELTIRKPHTYKPLSFSLSINVYAFFFVAKFILVHWWEKKTHNHLNTPTSAKLWNENTETTRFWIDNFSRPFNTYRVYFNDMVHTSFLTLSLLHVWQFQRHSIRDAMCNCSLFL